DERLLEGLSRAGAGHFYFVETPVQIPDCLTSELGEALQVVARDAAVTVRAADGITVETLNRFSLDTNADGQFSIRLGDLASRQEVSLVLRLTFPTGKEGEARRAVFGVTDAQNAINEPDAEIAWTFADHRANDRQSRNAVVDLAVAELYAAQAQAEALELNRAGRFKEASARLERTALRIEQYAGNDPLLRDVIMQLRERHEVYAMPMSAMRSKSEHFASANAASMRGSDGKARRR
ncbi:MAG: hypothetical protein ABJC89_07860, partial [Acidobacteriota bacterium]